MKAEIAQARARAKSFFVFLESKIREDKIKKEVGTQPTFEEIYNKIFKKELNFF